jgi:5-methyltetrahydropteroyltriglutamate--homocysteine methyltransferase
VPEWLVAAPSEQALIDATRVVIATQEAAGVDVGLRRRALPLRRQPSRDERDDRVLRRPMQGVRYGMTFDEVIGLSRAARHALSHPPARVVDGAGVERHARPAAARASARRRWRPTPFKFTVTGPHMLAKTLLDRHYADRPSSPTRSPTCLAEQVQHLDADVVQLDEANLPGHPEEWEWAARALNRVLDAVKTTPAVHLCFGNYGGQSVQSGTWDSLIRYLNALHADHVVLECAHRPPEEIAVFKALKPRSASASASSTSRPTRSSRPTRWRGRSSAPRRRSGAAGSVHPPGLRLLDAEAPDRRREDPRARTRARSVRRSPLH